MYKYKWSTKTYFQNLLFHKNNVSFPNLLYIILTIEGTQYEYFDFKSVLNSRNFSTIETVMTPN